MVAINEQFQYHKELKNRANAPNSDHYPFTLKGVPAIFIYTLGGRYGGYHAPKDNCERCGLEEYERTLRLLIEGVEKGMCILK
jgi:Zn-dependent M28 family amino/carboxypeptidase